MDGEMAEGVTWTPQALADLEATYLFIQREAQQQARLFAEKVLETIERLALFPRSGRVVPEFGLAEYREVPVWSYRLIYRVGEGEIYLLTIHQHPGHWAHCRS